MYSITEYGSQTNGEAMNEYRFKYGMFLALGCGYLLSTAEAKAQFYPGGFNPYAGGMNRYSQFTPSGYGIYNPSLYSPLQFNSTFSNSYSYVNPATGIPYSFNYSFQYSGYAPYIPGVTNRYNNAAIYNPNQYYNLAQNSYDSPGNNPIVAQRLRILKQAGRMPARNMNDPKANAMARPAQPDAAGQPQEMSIEDAQVEAELLNPSEESLLSGEALNQLAKAIQPLKVEHPKVTGPFITKGVLEDVRFQGSDAANILTLFSKVGNELSKPFLKPANIAARVALKEPLDAFKKAYATGKPIPTSTIDGLSKGISSAELALDQSESDDVDAMSQYVATLKKVLDYSQTADGRAAYNPKWFSIGTSVHELLDYTTKYKVEFAAGDATARTEYRLLYRAMLDYYAKLKTAS